MKIIYYLPESSDADPCMASGGARVSYRHVELLAAHGYDAVVLHNTAGFCLSWFEHEAKIEYADSLTLGPDDILVLTEGCGPDAGEAMPGVRKVIFNQNTFATFGFYNLDPGDKTTPYLHDDLIGVIVASDYAVEYMKHVFPTVPLQRLRLSLDPALFPYRPFEQMSDQIAFMPRKLPVDLTQVINILKFRGVLEGFELCAIDGMDEEGVGAILSESRFFLSSSLYEGFGLPPAEAMLSGAVVIGYHGFGGREFMKPELCYPVEQGDVLGFAVAVEKAIHAYRKDSAPLAEMARKASDFIAATYTPENEKNDLLAAWKNILGDEAL